MYCIAGCIVLFIAFFVVPVMSNSVCRKMVALAKSLPPEGERAVAWEGGADSGSGEVML